MTVTYSAEVATSRGFGCFWKLLFRWRGSIYKLLWPDMALYFTLYYLLSIIYRFALKEDQKRFFEKVSLYCSTYGDLIPVSFVLGFYVSLVVKRWWDSFTCIPWPDSLAFFVSAFIHGQDDRGRLMRRSIMRYVNLAFVVTLTCISPCVKKRFPTLDHLVEAGILLPNEKKIIEQLKTTHSTYWMPLVWASSIATRARKEGRIRDDFALKTVIDAIAHYRSLCGGLFNYDWISIPLVYTQVVTLVVYTFFLSSLMGRQYLDPDQGYHGYEVDLYIPVFNFLQFFFYMGWLKVAETLVNPFGEDDDDFEVNWVIDRDIQVSYLIVDDMHQEHPELIKDQYWDEVMPDLPYTAASKPFYSEPPQGSAASLIVPAHEAEFLPLETVVEDSDDDDQLDDIKVDGAVSVPVNPSNRRTRLSRNYSESSQSSISGLGRSFHPHSQQRKNVISLLHRLFSQDHGRLGSSSSLQSRRSKHRRKDDSRDSNASPSSNPSIPPTPSECRSHLHGFPDDIFHLSDLSLADSRGTSVAQSPGVFSTMQLTDIFGRPKPERPHRFPLQMQFSQPKGTTAVTPQNEIPDEESVSPLTSKKRRTNSLKYFFRSGSKQVGSQKSLVDSVRTEPSEKLKTPSTNSMEVDDSVQATLVPGDENDDSGDSIQEEIFDEAETNSISSATKGSRKSSVLSQTSLSKSRHSLPQVILPLSNEKSTKLEKTLNSEPSVTVNNENNQNITKAVSSERVQESNLQDVKPIQQKPTPLIYRKIFSSLKPKRTVSLFIHDVNNPYAKTQKGTSKFYSSKEHNEIIYTGSQPVTPTEQVSLQPKLKIKSARNIFRRAKNASFKVKKSTESVKSSVECPEIIVSSQNNKPLIVKNTEDNDSVV